MRKTILTTLAVLTIGGAAAGILVAQRAAGAAAFGHGGPTALDGLDAPWS